MLLESHRKHGYGFSSFGYGLLTSKIYPQWRHVHFGVVCTVSPFANLHTVIAFPHLPQRKVTSVMIICMSSFLLDFRFIVSILLQFAGGCLHRLPCPAKRQSVISGRWCLPRVCLWAAGRWRFGCSRQRGVDGFALLHLLPVLLHVLLHRFLH